MRLLFEIVETDPNLPAPATSVLTTASCPACREPAVGELHTCARCGTPYHQKCWQQMMSCMVRGCSPPATELPAVPEAKFPDQLFGGSLALMVLAGASGMPVVAVVAFCGLFATWWRTWTYVQHHLTQPAKEALAPAGTAALHLLGTAFFIGTPMILAFGVGILIWIFCLLGAAAKVVDGLVTDRDKGRALTGAGLIALLLLILRLGAR